jgi:large subunit ribosomal protein L24
MGSSLDGQLQEKYNRRSAEVKKGDEVKVMRGKFKGKQGKVGVVDVSNCRIQVEGLQRAKRGGEKVETWFHPSKVKIIALSDNEKKRFKTGKVEEKKENKKEAKK